MPSAAVAELEGAHHCPFTRQVRPDLVLTDIVMPPIQDLQLLHALACEGDMRQIIRWAQRVSDLDERYASFTDQVSKLAKQYESLALLRLVEQHLEIGG